MEKLMILKELSQLQSRNIQDQQGNTSTIEWFEAVLSDGLDTVLCETNKQTTANFKQMAPQLGIFYACSIRLQVVSYKKDNADKSFFKAILTECKQC